MFLFFFGNERENNIIEERFEEATDFILDSFEEWSDEE